MKLGTDTLVMAVIVTGAAIWGLRSAWRSVRSKRICSTCGSAGECPLAGGKAPLQDLGPKRGDPSD